MSEDFKNMLVVFVILSMVFSLVAYMAVTPMPRERFINLFLLGEEGTFEHYYPGDDPNISPGMVLRWRMAVINNMSSAQIVVVEVKLGNASSTSPDWMNCTASPLPVVYEFRRALVDGEVWVFPFYWSVTGVEQGGDVVSITSLVFNDVLVNVSGVSAVYGHNLRLIFELWTLDLSSGEYVFGWSNGGYRRCAWLQMWFNLTLT